jgi:(p)ppGpp synthase/HD superfamily hydrolase
LLEFGEEVAILVDGVTKLGKVQFSSRERIAGGEHTQNAARHGEGYSRYYDQTG